MYCIYCLDTFLIQLLAYVTNNDNQGILAARLRIVVKNFFSILASYIQMKRLLKCIGALHMSQISSTAKELSQIINNFYCSKFLYIYNILAEYHFYHASASLNKFSAYCNQKCGQLAVDQFQNSCNLVIIRKLTLPRTPRITPKSPQSVRAYASTTFGASIHSS